MLNHVLGKTKGYTKQPQINRFKEVKDPLGTLSNYLRIIASEADERGYKVDASKILY
ncbi:hypothetical protein HOH45_02360 [bacterium]|nr:hypothetical protein [bacterium]